MGEQWSKKMHKINKSVLFNEFSYGHQEHVGLVEQEGFQTTRKLSTTDGMWEESLRWQQQIM